MQYWHININEFRKLWDSGATVRDIAAKLNTTISIVYRLRVMYRMTPRKRSGKQMPDPSVDEIYKAAAAIRAKWSRARLAEASVGGWTPPNA